MTPRAQVREHLQSFPRWILISHEKPDGDTLGCASALHALARQQGIEVRWWGKDPLPSLYAFLPGSKRYETVQDASAARSALGDDPWLWVFLDTSRRDRSLPGLPVPAPGDLFLNLDHHGDNDAFGDVNWVDPQAAAVGEMVTDLLLDGPWDWGQDVATGLYVALSTDTGSFRYESTTGATHRAAAALLDRGVDLSTVEDGLHRRFQPGTLHLWGAVLSRSRFGKDGSVVVSWVEEEDYRIHHSDPSETENLVNLLLSLRTAVIAALVTPHETGSRVSLRTRPPVDARALASRFGGGGHPRAAGFRMEETLSQATARLLEEFSRHDVFGHPATR